MGAAEGICETRHPTGPGPLFHQAGAENCGVTYAGSPSASTPGLQVALPTAKLRLKICEKKPAVRLDNGRVACWLF